MLRYCLQTMHGMKLSQRVGGCAQHAYMAWRGNGLAAMGMSPTAYNRSLQGRPVVLQSRLRLVDGPVTSSTPVAFIARTGHGTILPCCRGLPCGLEVGLVVGDIVVGGALRHPGQVGW